jgi:hypothetical protein
MRFLGGLVVGLILGAGGYLGYQQYRASSDPCLGHCGVGSSCIEGVCMVLEQEPEQKRRKRRRRRGRRRRRASAADQQDLLIPSAADLKPATRGPSLRGTDYVDLGDEDPAARELSTSEIDARVRRIDHKIVGCIDMARGDYRIDSGKVTVGFRIERSGRIKKVRVTAPSLLMRAGLHGCVKPLLGALRFGPTTRSVVMTYPFSLD